MIVIENISEKVKTLLEKYEFNVNTLAKYYEEKYHNNVEY